MFLVATAMLVGVTTALPQVRGPVALASTYDEASCAEAAQESERAPEDSGLNDCSERGLSVVPAVTAVPAVIDCNDARMSIWVAEMIGSCDMPKGDDRTAAVRPADGRPQNRLCDGLHCSRKAPPLRATLRQDGGCAPCLFVHRTLSPEIQATPLGADGQSSPREVPSRRLERPPRLLL